MLPGFFLNQISFRLLKMASKFRFGEVIWNSLLDVEIFLFPGIHKIAK